MYGFKSFARKTEIPFEESMNIIVGPNGSGKSNITDALCFVLGRLSIKSIRAAKAANLLFSGNSLYKGANEASVELVLDNVKREFPIDKDDIVIKRIVRKNGQSTYRINSENKTRQELLELLAQAGIDPNGFNIVLQGEIAAMIKMSSEDRRKILEDVAGISVYETRKEKSINELNKAEERLKEVSAVLKERNSYLKGLEKERQDALLYQKLDLTIKRCKKSLINSSIMEKEKNLWGINKIVENLSMEIQDLKKKIQEKNINIEQFQSKMSDLNKKIQESTSNEQEKLHGEIADLKAKLAGYVVRRENFEKRIIDFDRKVQNLDVKKDLLEKEINNIQTNSPDIKKKQLEQKKLQEMLDKLEQQRRKFYLLKSQISTVENQITEKEKYMIESKKEMDLIQINIDSMNKELKYSKSIELAEKLKIDCKNKLYDLKTDIDKINDDILIKERENAVFENLIKQEEKLRDSILSLNKCPTCKQEVVDDYKKSIRGDSQTKIDGYLDEKQKNVDKFEELKEQKILITNEFNSLNMKTNLIEIDMINLKNIEEKNMHIKKIINQRQEIKDILENLNKKLSELNKDFVLLINVENDYDNVRLKLQELNFADIDVDSEVSIKQREISRIDSEKRNLIRDIEDSNEELKKVVVLIDERQKDLSKKEIEEQKLYEKCEKLFEERNEMSDREKVLETEIVGLRHTIQDYDEKINMNKINRAQILAQLESLKSEIESYKDVEVLPLPMNEIKEKLQHSQFRISQVGNVNMRSLEVFDKVSEQVKLISEKVAVLESERIKIQQIIDEIDKKKKKSFLQTLDSINEYFSRNYSQLSTKGEIILELEDKKEPFNGGLNILIRVSKSKYFDITSLSGGEKTMVSLALIFAIQEYKPYCFYIFDEIDAALDKHNSELLSALIKKYMKTGQYIIITHNDTLISEASSLYGVSMQENISKVISLKI